jgi:PAS domain S-box-containing protein
VLQSLRDQTQQVTVARFEAERRMRSLQRYADFFESAADGIVVLDQEGRLLFSNPKAREITGYDEQDLQGRSLGELFVPEDLRRLRELREGFSKGQYPSGVDVRVLRKDGTPIVLSLAFNSVLREEGVVLCNFRDVTHDRAVASELLQTKNFLERVIDSSVDAIISADLKGNVLLFNRAAERIYGTSAGTVIGTDVRKLYPEGTAGKVMSLIRQGGGRVESLKTEILTHGGEHVPVSLSASLLYDHGKPVGSVGIFTDLREKMRMEQRLQQAQEQLIAQERQAVIAELAGTAAHELNQPLTTVVMSADLLRRKIEPTSPAASIAEVIRAEAERMAEIVRKIGKITKYETKPYVGQAKILDLDKTSEEETTARAQSSAPPSGGVSGQ